MEGYEVLVAMVTVLAGILLLFSLLAYGRERSWRLMVIATVFALFFIKGLILSMSIFLESLEEMSDMLAVTLLIDIVILLFLFITGFKGSKDKEPIPDDIKESEEERT